MSRGTGINPASARRAVARKLAMQALYRWQINKAPWQDVLNEFAADEEMRKADRGYFNQLVTDVCGGSEELDAALAAWMDRKPGELDPVERACSGWAHTSCAPLPTCRIAWSSTKPSASPSVSAPPTATSSSTPCWTPPPRRCDRTNTETPLERLPTCRRANSNSSQGTSRISARVAPTCASGSVTTARC
jgi:hypothetical protein